MDERIKQNNELEEAASDAVPEKHTLTGALGTLATMGLVDVLAHLGPTGLVIGGIASYVVWKHGPEVYEQLGSQLPLPAMPELPHMKRKQIGGRSFWDRALGRYPQVVEMTADVVEQEQEEDLPVFTIDEIFSEEEQDDVPGMERITIEQAIAHTTPNSYRVFVGRSLTDDIGRARSIDFRGKHLKFIGASQRGKSSEVAALLTQIIATHTPDHVQIAPLDLEDRTGRLFADSPHVKRIRVDGKEVRLHATNVDQVLEYLTYITKFMDVRYKLPQSELEKQPILLVYIEEFLRLRRMLKSRIASASPGPARDKAQRDYSRLLECIDALAARSLKARIQLWLCAQVDYVDPDLRDALANVVEGFSFCVKPTAAQAAGFTRADYLARNHAQKRVGQAVIETTDLTDIIAAVEFPLAARLRDLDTVPVYTARETMPEMMFEVDTSDRRQHFQIVGKSSGEVPDTHLSTMHALPGSSGEVPQTATNEPVEQSEDVPGDFRPREDDFMLSEVQIQVFLAYYRTYGNIGESLAQIKNERGQGLGARYHRHASYLLEVHGLKKRRA